MKWWCKMPKFLSDMHIMNEWNEMGKIGVSQYSRYLHYHMHVQFFVNWWSYPIGGENRLGNWRWWWLYFLLFLLSICKIIFKLFIDLPNFVSNLKPRNFLLSLPLLLINNDLLLMASFSTNDHRLLHKMVFVVIDWSYMQAKMGCMLDNSIIYSPFKVWNKYEEERKWRR